MKLQTIVPAVLFVAASSVSFAAYSATMAEAPLTDVKVDQPAFGAADRASIDGKSDVQKSDSAVAAESPKTVVAKSRADQDRSRHFHPRDGK